MKTSTSAETAGSGTEALRAVTRARPDLIVTDIVMPEMDGVELLKILRSVPSTQGIPVLLISGHAPEELRIEGFREGADGYLAKPYSGAELRALIGSMLRTRHRSDEAHREALQELERRALADRAALLESITDAFYALDREWRFTYLNQRALDHFGKPREELLGKSLWETIPAARGTAVESEYTRALTEQCPLILETVSPVTGSWVEARVYPTGQGLAVYFHDVSDRKRAEEALRDSDRRKDEFLALLAHELRNPLAPISNGVEILRLRVAADPIAERALGMMDRQLNHLVRLVDELLDASRITRGKILLRREPLFLADVLERSLEACRPLIAARAHSLEVDIREPALPVEGDPDRLQQVLTNLVTNSAKYTGAGGIIRVTMARDRQEAVIAVADSGIGLPPQALEEIFEMFAQVRSSAPHAGGGLGIGLALARLLVTLHGGTVGAASPGLGQGSTFTVRLPLSGAPAAARQAGLPGTAPKASRQSERRILVVDDNADAAASLEVLLRLKGHIVSTAADGQEAIERARAFRPDIVFMDIGMPRMDGLEAARHILAQTGLRGVHIVALTGWDQSADRERSREAGMVAHLVKPVVPERLDEILSSLEPDG